MSVEAGYCVFLAGGAVAGDIMTGVGLASSVKKLFGKEGDSSQSARRWSSTPVNPRVDDRENVRRFASARRIAVPVIPSLGEMATNHGMAALFVMERRARPKTRRPSWVS